MHNLGNLGRPQLTFAHPSRGITASSTGSLLNVERTLPTAPASSVGLVMPLTETGSTFTYNLRNTSAKEIIRLESL